MTIQAPVRAATEDALRETILSVFQAHTEYARDDIDPEADIEGDLGIDSIILASIQADIYQKLELDDRGVQPNLSNIGQLVSHVEQRLTAEGKDTVALTATVAGATASPATPAAQSTEHDWLCDAVLEVYQHHTGYSREELSLDADLEGDLGIDSVTHGMVLAELPKLRGVESVAFPGVNTIGEVIDHLRSVPGESPPPPRGVVVAAETAGADAEGNNQGNAGRLDGNPASTDAGGSGSETTDAVADDTVSALIERVVRADADPTPVNGSATQLQIDGLSFSARGISGKEIGGFYQSLRDTQGIPDAVRLVDCDTPEKLLQYVRAVRQHQLEKIDSGSVRQASNAVSQDDDPRTMQDFVDLPHRDLFHKAREFRKFYRGKQQAQLYWYGMPLESQCRNRAVIYDEITGKRREFLMFASNNYLGLANHPDVIAAIADAARKYGATNTGCRIIGGTNRLHKELERRLADLKKREACILYPSGYSANLGCISALAGRRDLVFTDGINHMSIQDGCKLSGAQRKIYAHSMESLETALRKHSDHEGGRLIVTDGVFSMHGDILDLPRLLELARRFGARVLVDDAHATGVLGKTGSGTAEHFNLKGAVDLELGTLSKALAGIGGFVCGDEDVIEYLRFYSNSYVFAATVPAPVVAGMIVSVDVMAREPQRLERLWNNIHYLRGHLQEAGFDLERSNSAIIPVVVGDDKKTLEFGRAVRARGMYCQTVVFPGVAVGDARLRISVTSEHTTEDLDLAAQILLDAAEETGIAVTRH